MLSFRFRLQTVCAVTGLLAFASFLSFTAQAAPAKAPAPLARKAQEPADAPAPKMGGNGQIEARFQQLHQAFLQRGKQGKIGVLFLGDSITEGWNGAKDVWDAHFGKYAPANFGISGDRTQHVLWRIANGELDGIHPRVVVLMIGTNNIGYRAEDILRGDVAIVNAIHRKLPQSKILLLGIFPRGHDAGDMIRDRITVVNDGLEKLDKKQGVRYLDIGGRFLDADGTLPKEVMPDALHPNHRGYEIWADAMQPTLDRMMK